MLRSLALAGAALVASSVCIHPARAQQLCGISGVTVTVKPECAVPGTPIAITIANNSAQVITFPSSCVYGSVHPSTDCTGAAVFAPVCLAVLTPLGPGQSLTQFWDQRDDNGQQVPDGEYSFSISYLGGGCCAGVTIGPAVASFCTAKQNSQGCVPQMGFNGTPSAQSPAAFQVKASGMINNKQGMLFYGYGQASTPFMGGILCVQSPIVRLPAQGSGGNPPPDDCSGRYGFDMNAHIQSGVDPGLVPGASVAAQYWQRDPAHPDGTGFGLSNALTFCIQP